MPTLATPSNFDSFCEKDSLRVLSECIILIGSTNFYATFNCRTNVISLFGTLKDGSLQINSSAFNKRFSYRNIFQDGVKALAKIAWNKQNFVYFWLYDFVQISPAYGPKTYQICRERFYTPNVSISNGYTEELYPKFVAKIHFPIMHFILPLLMLTWEA